MNYEEFKQELKQKIRQTLPAGLQEAQIIIDKVPRKNAIQLEGLRIMMPEDRIVPRMFLQSSYEEYMVGKKIEEIANEMIACYQQSPPVEYSELEELFDYDKVKDRLSIQLVNSALIDEKSNERFYYKIPDLDLSAAVNILMMKEDDKVSSIPVNKDLANKWGVDGDRLYQDALSSTENLFPPILRNLYDVLSFKKAEKDTIEECRMAPYEQYILTNTMQWNGAAVLLYPDILEAISKNANANLFILPSSTHETILMKDTGEINATELQRMVTEANRSEVLEPEDILSNQIYYYDAKEHSLTVATTEEETEELRKTIQSHFEADEIISFDNEVERE